MMEEKNVDKVKGKISLDTALGILDNLSGDLKCYLSYNAGSDFRESEEINLSDAADFMDYKFGSVGNSIYTNIKHNIHVQEDGRHIHEMNAYMGGKFYSGNGIYNKGTPFRKLTLGFVVENSKNNNLII